jgi:hypothetical protein
VRDRGEVIGNDVPISHLLPLCKRARGPSPKDRAMTDNVQQVRELREAWRAVANAKLVEFRQQCWRLSMLVRCGAIDKLVAIDRLYEIAIAHALVRSLGDDRIEAIIAEAFTDTDHWERTA